jgi:hypothetical protein
VRYIPFGAVISPPRIRTFPIFFPAAREFEGWEDNNKEAALYAFAGKIVAGVTL